MTAEAESLLDLAPPPAGWSRLPAGVTRTVRVYTRHLGTPGGRVFRVSDGSETKAYAACVVEGPARFVHDALQYSAFVETEASILVRA